MTLDEHIKQIIDEAIEKNGFNKSKAAKELNITRVTLNKYATPKKLKKEIYLTDDGKIRIKKVLATEEV